MHVMHGFCPITLDIYMCRKGEACKLAICMHACAHTIEMYIHIASYIAIAIHAECPIDLLYIAT